MFKNSFKSSFSNNLCSTASNILDRPTENLVVEYYTNAALHYRNAILDQG